MGRSCILRPPPDSKMMMAWLPVVREIQSLDLLTIEFIAGYWYNRDEDLLCFLIWGSANCEVGNGRELKYGLI